MRTRFVLLAVTLAALPVTWSVMGCSSKGDFWERGGGTTRYRTAPSGPGSSYGLQPVDSSPPPTGWGIPQGASRRRAPRRVASAPRSVPRSPAGTANSSTSEELEVLAQVNAIRARRGLGALSYNPSLYRAAQDHSLEQQKHGYMGHGSPDPSRRTLAQRMKQAGYVGRAFGEVVAKGYRSTGGVIRGWMNSPSHRDILVDGDLTEAAFSRVGTYWTGNFGAPFPAGSSRNGTWHRVPVGMVHDTPAYPGASTPSYSTPSYSMPSYTMPAPVPYAQTPYVRAPYRSVTHQAPSFASPTPYRDRSARVSTWGSATPYASVPKSNRSGVEWVATSVKPDWTSSAVPYRGAGQSNGWAVSVPYNEARGTPSWKPAPRSTVAYSAPEYSSSQFNPPSYQASAPREVILQPAPQVIAPTPCPSRRSSPKTRSRNRTSRLPPGCRT